MATKETPVSKKRFYEKSKVWQQIYVIFLLTITIVLTFFITSCQIKIVESLLAQPFFRPVSPHCFRPLPCLAGARPKPTATSTTIRILHAIPSLICNRMGTEANLGGKKSTQRMFTIGTHSRRIRTRQNATILRIITSNCRHGQKVEELLSVWWKHNSNRRLSKKMVEVRRAVVKGKNAQLQQQ